MTAISKIAGGLSLVSCAHDIHKNAVIYSNNAYAKVSSDTIIASSIGSQKANRLSTRDAQRKNFFAKHNFLLSTKEFFARIGGYLKGVGCGIINYAPNIVLQGLTLFAKNKTLANVSAACLGALEAFDLIKNGTNFGQRTDYLK